MEAAEERKSGGFQLMMREGGKWEESYYSVNRMQLYDVAHLHCQGAMGRASQVLPLQFHSSLDPPASSQQIIRIRVISVYRES